MNRVASSLVHVTISLPVPPGVHAGSFVASTSSLSLSGKLCGFCVVAVATREDQVMPVIVAGVVGPVSPVTALAAIVIAKVAICKLKP